MTGDPITPFLTNANQQGLLKGYEERAYQALKHDADGVPPADSPAVGRQAANDRLDSFFAYDRLLADPAKTAREVWVNGPYDYYNADKYNPQNEPDLIAPYTYLSTGEPWKTTDVVHAALTLFTDAPSGMT